MPDLSVIDQTPTNMVNPNVLDQNLLNAPAEDLNLTLNGLLAANPQGSAQTMQLMLAMMQLMTQMMEQLIRSLGHGGGTTDPTAPQPNQQDPNAPLVPANVNDANTVTNNPDRETTHPIESSDTSEGSCESCDSDTDSEATWRVDRASNTITLDNGYQLHFINQRQTWTLSDQSGQTLRVWGDPHVDEDNDGDTDWDFKQDATFILDDGTKITVGTVDIGHANDMTVSDTLTISKGEQAIQVTGIATNNVQIGDPSLSGVTLDAATNDGFLFFAGDDGINRWYDDNGQRITEDQAMGPERHFEYSTPTA